MWTGIKSKTSACTYTFDKLRLEIYTSSTKGIDALHPTSSVIHGHIHRAYFLIEMAIIILREIFLRNLIRGSSSFWFYFDLYVTTLFEVILLGVVVVPPLSGISRYLKFREDKNSD